MSIFNELDSKFELTVTSATRGVGSFLTLDFKIDTQRNGREDYHLWVYLADWVITQNLKPLLDSEEENDASYEKVLNRFLGRKLLEFVVKDHVIKFEFEDKLTIRLLPDPDFYEDTDELFMFFDREKKLVTSYTLESGLVTETIKEKGSD